MALSPAGSTTHQPEDEVLRAELLKIVVRGAGANWSSGIGAALLIATFFPVINDDHGGWVVWTWCTVVILIMLRGVWMAKQACGVRRADTERLFGYGDQLVVHVGYTGVAWGAASWIFLPVDSPSAEAFLMAVMAMVLMGGACNQAAYRQMPLIFTFCFAIVFSSGLARLGDRYHVALATAFALYALTAAMYGRSQGATVRRQVLSKLENQSLRAIAESERARADSASAAKTAFLAAASHDLRQPLHALVQYSAHLNRTSDDPKLEETVRRIGSSVDAMRDLLDSILDLSKLMVGGVRAIVAPFPVESLLERLDVQLRPLTTAKGLQFVTDRSGAIVMSDHVLLERILRNLVLNSIRYTSQGQVMIRCRQRRNVLELQVWDTGIGIPGGDLLRIFDPFYQVDNRARDRGKGLGIGLAIVRELCDLLGHHVKVKTKVGRGTVFVVSVPLCTDSNMLVLIPLQQSGGRAGRDYVRGAFIVLVDDDPLSREASAHTLKTFGCRVIAAASAAEAIEKLQQQEFAPQLIVADYRLEAGTGIEAIRSVTENLQILFGDTFSIPALVVSGDTAPEELRQVNEHGYPMLHKPVATEDLWGTLNRLLERKAQEMEF